MHMRVRGALVQSTWVRLLCLLAMVAGSLGSPATHTEMARASAKEGRFYAETGKTLAGEFVRFYDENGGVLQFGYPVTEARMEEVSPGKRYLVQWTERQRLEYHPENAGTRYEVLLGLLGRELTAGLEGPRFQPGDGPRTTDDSGLSILQALSFTPSPLSFPETGHTVSEPFLSYWEENGGLDVYGYPISAAFRDDSGLLVQWFERARFEYHPEYADHEVLLGHLGLETLKKEGEAEYDVEVYPQAAPDSGLSIDVAQGGESEDPHFLDNVREAGKDLGSGLVRLDNVFNFYGIVERQSDGTVKYNWTNLDVALDAVRAMGKEPMICLSYMPETMSANGLSRTMPPSSFDEWGALVKATVAHVNGVSGVGGEGPSTNTHVTYWEVWNEPDQWGFWQGSYPDYLRLYDVTLDAVKSVDPEARVGGPAVARFSPDHLDEFLKHEASLGSGRVDFVSWHEYGQSPDELASHIREARGLVAKYPDMSAELFVTEFNILQGGEGDTSAHKYTDYVEGAIAFLGSIESMERERLDRAFLFELKDGKGPEPFWGRWGVLTNDGKAKPIYYALKAYETRPAGKLPVILKSGAADGSLGVMAYGGGDKGTTMMVWYTGEGVGRVKVGLQGEMVGRKYALTLFDSTHNNPAVTGDGTLHTWAERDGGDLVMELKPNSLVLIEAMP